MQVFLHCWLEEIIFKKKFPLAGLFSFYGNSTCWLSHHVLIHHALPPLSALLIKMVISQSDSSHSLIRWASCSTHEDLCLALFPQTENKAHLCLSKTWVLKTPVEWQKMIKLNTPSVPPHWVYVCSYKPESTCSYKVGQMYDGIII